MTVPPSALDTGRRRPVPWADGAVWEVENPGYAVLGVDFEDVAVFDDVLPTDLLTVVGAAAPDTGVVE